MKVNLTREVYRSTTSSPPRHLYPPPPITTRYMLQDLVIDVSASTGAGGRVMESYLWELYDWSIEQASDAPFTELTDVAAASASGGSSKLTVPTAGRASQNELTWFFNVTATNWLGGVGWKSIEVGSNCNECLVLAFHRDLVANCLVFGWLALSPSVVHPVHRV